MIALAALGARTRRNAAALALAVPGVYLLTGVQLAGEPLGVAFAFANAVLFAALHRARPPRGAAPALAGIDGLAASMLVAAVVVTPIGGWQALPALDRPGGAARRHRRGHLLVGDPLRLRPARDARGSRAPPTR